MIRKSNNSGQRAPLGWLLNQRLKRLYRDIRVYGYPCVEIPLYRDTRIREYLYTGAFLYRGIPIQGCPHIRVSLYKNIPI